MLSSSTMKLNGQRNMTLITQISILHQQKLDLTMVQGDSGMGSVITTMNTAIILLTFPPLVNVIPCPFLSFLAASLTGYSNKSWEVPFSRTPEIMNISMSSNTGQPGIWIFRIDKEEIIPACVDEGM